MRCVVLVVIFAIAAACSQQLRPTSPTTPAVDFTGVWEGRARIASCGGSTCDPRTCGNVLGRGAAGGDQREIRVSFTQRDTSVTAQLNTDRSAGLQRIEPLQGTIRETTTAVLDGQLTTGTPPDHVVTRVSNFSATMVLNEVRGGFTYVIDRPGSAAGLSCSSFRDQIRLEYEFSSLQRVSQ